jgi:hypothetical protein
MAIQCHSCGFRAIAIQIASPNGRMSLEDIEVVE